MNACFYGNQQQGGGHRGGRQRGGYQGQGGGDGSGDITRYRQFFQEERNVKKATGFLKGLTVSDPLFPPLDPFWRQMQILSRST